MNRAQFLAINNELYQKYTTIEPGSLVSENKKAFWIEGNSNIKKALFLAHGYMGTPNEMKFLAKPFIEAGWAVIGFLIPGHGASSVVANCFDKTIWRFEMKRQLEMVLASFDEVSAIGFSTGGLLLHDYVTHNKVSDHLKSLHLISPFFKQRVGGQLKLIDLLLQKIFNNMSVDTAYALTRFPDLSVMCLDRESYSQNIPVLVAKEIKALGSEIQKKAAPLHKLKLPTQLYLSENDWTVKTEISKQVINRDIEGNFIELVWYPGKEPHHLMAPLVSGVAGDIQKRLFSSLSHS